MELLFESRVEVQGISGRTVFFQRPPAIHPEPVLQPDTPADGAGAVLPAPEAADCIVRLHLDQAEVYAYDLTNDH